MVDQLNKASLTVVGSGIKFLSHLTSEARAYITCSDIVLYLVNDPAMKEWIKKSAPRSESLDELYIKYHLRLDCYNAITNHILETLYTTNQHLCVVLYGHPSVFSQPGLNAALKAKAEGYQVKVLPGISAEDCLFADLLIDPGSFGCQSFEATDFLIYNRQFDPGCHLILWQVDIIGVLDNPQEHDNNNGINVLVNYLKQYYNATHEVILYEAAQYPSFEPYVQRLTLNELPNARFSRISTLYVPPAYQASCDENMIKILNMGSVRNYIKNYNVS